MQSSEEDNNTEGNKKLEKKLDLDNKNFIPVFHKVSNEIDDIIKNGKKSKISKDSSENKQNHVIKNEKITDHNLHGKEFYNPSTQNYSSINKPVIFDDKKEELFEITKFSEVDAIKDLKEDSIQKNDLKLDDKNIDDTSKNKDNKENVFFNKEKKKKIKIKFNKKVDEGQKKSLFDTSFFTKKSKGEEENMGKNLKQPAFEKTKTQPQNKLEPTKKTKKPIEEKKTKIEKPETPKKQFLKNDKTEKKSFSLFKKEEKKESKKPKKSDSKKESQTVDQTTQDREETINIYKDTEQKTDEELIKFLKVTDDLLGKLPEHVISEFASSEDFNLYQKIMEKYKVK